MRNQNPKNVEILNDKNLKFRCKHCGEIWFPKRLPNRKLKRGSWNCPVGCAVWNFRHVKVDLI